MDISIISQLNLRHHNKNNFCKRNRNKPKCKAIMSFVSDLWNSDHNSATYMNLEANFLCSKPTVMIFDSNA